MVHNQTNTPWTEEACDALRELAGQRPGFTAAIIADKLNASVTAAKPVSRNAVIAKCTAMGIKLAFAHGVQDRSKTRTQPVKVKGKRKHPKLPPNLPEIVPLRSAEVDLSHRCTIMGLSRSTCHWPLWGYERGGEKFYCGTPIKDGNIYCDAHAAIGFEKPSGRKIRPGAWWLRPR